MPTRLCLEPTCPNPAGYRGRCTTHNRTNEHSINRAGRNIYGTKRWQLLRRHVLLQQPICAHCDNALSVDVDHITAIDAGGDPWDRANLQGLCKRCHSAKTRQEQATP